MPTAPASMRGRQLDEQDRAPADERAQRADQRREGDVGGDDLAPEAPARPAGHQPRLDHQRPERPEDEHHERVAHQPVAESPRPGEPEVLRDRQRLDVPHAAVVEVARGRVVDGVLVTPAVKRREDEQPARDADPVVGACGWAGTSRGRSRGRR